MRNQKGGPRLEARKPRAAASAEVRERLRPMGHEFDQLMRTSIVRMARSCGVVPAPNQLFYDLAPERGRPASLATAGNALAALAESPTLPDCALEEFVNHLVDWMRSIRPQPMLNAHDLWAHETHAQAAADPWQALVLRALETGDVVLLERAIETTGVQLTRLQQYHVYLLAQFREQSHRQGHRRFA